MKIKNEVMNVLGECRVEGNKLFLPEAALDRSLYVAVNKVLESIGGKWSRKEKAHVFAECPADTIESIFLTGEYTDSKKEFQFYETPFELAKRLVEMAQLQSNERVLEPSAGRGRIANCVIVTNDCDCIELNPENRKFLESINYNLVGEDFLKFEGDYDVVIANPPFIRQQDIDHVLHMMKVAKRRVVSVMSASVMWRTNKKTVEFRNKIEQLGGTLEILPEESFRESGTSVNTCVVCVDVKRLKDEK